MNKWKKAVALLLCGALLLTGCGGQGDGQPTALKDVQKAFSAAIEEDYSRTLSQRINQEGGEVRTAGSAQAERAAQLLAAEMEALGLENVTVEAFATDTWHTQMGSLTYAAGGREITVPIYTTPTLFDSQGVAE